MERLTIKELAPYLPYGLTVRNEVDYTLIGIMPYRTINKNNGEDEFRLIVKSEDDAMDEFPLSDQCSILLRPLSSLTEEIDNNPNNLTYSSSLKLWTKEDIDYCKGNPLGMRYETVQQLLEWHFDVFGLHERGLALPIDGKEVEG